MDTTVERSSPKATLCVAGDGIDKAVIHPLIAINQPFPLARFWIETDNPVGIPAFLYSLIKDNGSSR